MVVEMAVLFPTLTKAKARALLHEAGLDFAADEISIERRDDRWRASLPGHRMA